MSRSIDRRNGMPRHGLLLLHRLNVLLSALMCFHPHAPLIPPIPHSYGPLSCNGVGRRESYLRVGWIPSPILRTGPPAKSPPPQLLVDTSPIKLPCASFPRPQPQHQHRHVAPLLSPHVPINQVPIIPELWHVWVQVWMLRVC